MENIVWLQKEIQKWEEILVILLKNKDLSVRKTWTFGLL